MHIRKQKPTKEIVGKSPDRHHRILNRWWNYTHFDSVWSQSSKCENILIENGGHVWATIRYRRYYFLLLPHYRFQITKNQSKSELKQWDVNKTFRFSSNNYQIRKKQLRITLIDNKEKPLYTMKLNLYKLMTGPFHNDFKIKTNWTDCVEQGRIIFDLKISQIVEFTIESVQTDM